MIEVTQEELWKLPEGRDYVFQIFSENGWRYVKLSFEYFGDLREVIERYEEIQSEEKRICRVGRYLPKYSKEPVIIEILRYYKPTS